MSAELNIREEMHESSIKMYLSGEIDIYTSQNFKSRIYEIIDSSETDLILDCKELNYIDSTGLGILVGALKKSKQCEKKIYLANLKDSIKKLFLITGLDKVFIIL